MKLVIVARVGFSDWLALMLCVLYLLCGTATGMLAYRAYGGVAVSILAGFFWPLGIAWMLFDHALCATLVKATFGFLLK